MGYNCTTATQCSNRQCFPNSNSPVVEEVNDKSFEVADVEQKMSFHDVDFTQMVPEQQTYQPPDYSHKTQKKFEHMNWEPLPDEFNVSKTQ